MKYFRSRIVKKYQFSTNCHWHWKLILVMPNCFQRGVFDGFAWVKEKKAVTDATRRAKHHLKLSEAYHWLGEAVMLVKVLLMVRHEAAEIFGSIAASRNWEFRIQIGKKVTDREVRLVS